MKNEFYVTLPSNVISKGPHEANVISNFKTTLKQRLIFPQNESWNVGLAEIIYTKTWFNVREDDVISFFDSSGEDHKFEKPKKPDDNVYKIPDDKHDCVPKGYYSTVEDLIKAINSKFEKITLESTRHPCLYYDDQRKVVFLRTGVLKDSQLVYFPIFGTDIQRILGLEEPDRRDVGWKIQRNIVSMTAEEGPRFPKVYNSLVRGYFKGHRAPDISAGRNIMYIYSDIVQQSVVGDAYAQLLKAIPIEQNHKFGDVVHMQFNKPHLIPLQSRNFDTIEIDLRDDTGKLIPFESGRVLVKLLFKKDG